MTSWMGHSNGGRVSKGCPAGGVLSPLLWSLVVDSLLRVLNGMGVKAVVYADDIAILARGAYEEVLRDVVQGAFKITKECYSSKALQIQWDKSVALIFTKCYKIRKLKMTKAGNLEIPTRDQVMRGGTNKGWQVGPDYLDLLGQPGGIESHREDRYLV